MHRSSKLAYVCASGRKRFGALQLGRSLFWPRWLSRDVSPLDLLFLELRQGVDYRGDPTPLSPVPNPSTSISTTHAAEICWIAVVGHRWYALLKRMMKLWKRMVQVCVCVCVCWSWRIRGEMKGWRGERFAPPGFHDSSLSPVFKAWQLVSLSALFACLFHGPPPSHFTAQGYCKSMHEIAMTNIWAGGSGCRVSSIEISSFFEFLVRRFLSGKEKERKLVGNIFLKWIF